MIISAINIFLKKKTEMNIIRAAVHFLYVFD